MKASLKIGLYILVAYGLTKWWINDNIPWDSVWLYENEQLARDNNTFMAKYVVAGADSAVLDSLVKFNMKPILDTLSFHVELSQEYKPKYLFFTQESLVEPVLVYRSPFMGDCANLLKYHKILGYDVPGIFFKALDEDRTLHKGYRLTDVAPLIFLRSHAFMDYDFDEEIALVCILARIDESGMVMESPLGKIRLKRVGANLGAKPSSSLNFYFLFPDFPQTMLDCSKFGQPGKAG
jgi:hypothetical protein